MEKTNHHQWIGRCGRENLQETHRFCQWSVIQFLDKSQNCSDERANSRQQTDHKSPNGIGSKVEKIAKIAKGQNGVLKD